MIEDALRRAGIHAGYAEARAKLAQELQAQEPAPTAEQIDFLARDVHKRRLNNPASYLTKVLRTGRWVSMVADLEYSSRCLNVTPNADPAAYWAREGEVESVLDSENMPCGCKWGAHKLGKRSCKPAG